MTNPNEKNAGTDPDAREAMGASAPLQEHVGAEVPPARPASDQTIKIENVGPITNLEIPIPEEGGVVVLRGRNRVGKTTALEATKRVLGGECELSPRDGTARGTVDGFGVRVTVGRAVRRTGELEAIHLEGKLSVAEMVDPGIKDPAKADAKRIKVIVNLSGVDPDQKKFRTLIGEELCREIPTAEEYDECTLLGLYSHYKKALYDYARRCECEQAKNDGKATAFYQAAGSTSIPKEMPDEGALRRRSLEVSQRQARFEESQRIGVELQLKASTAMDALEELDAPMADAVDAARQRRDVAARVVDDTEKQLDAAEATLLESLSALAEIEQANAAATEHRKTIADWESFVCPTDEQLDAATKDAKEAEEAWTDAIARRDARAKLDRAKECAAKAIEMGAESNAARRAAVACDRVLSEAIHSDRLSVKDGRLYVPHERGEVLYSQLSDGERWELALDLASSLIATSDGAASGLIVIPQNAWEGLDVANRQIVATFARTRRVTILTAEAQRDGEPPELLVKTV